MQDQGLTIGDLADAAGVGVETIRYYERRKLVPQPGRGTGAYRRYTDDHVNRVRFIKRAQALGFSLEEIGTLLLLEDGTDRASIRRIAATRLEETRRRIADLRQIEAALAHLLHDCESHARAPRCPIIAAIEASPGGDGPASHRNEKSRR